MFLTETVIDLDFLEYRAKKTPGRCFSTSARQINLTPYIVIWRLVKQGLKPTA